MEKQRSSLRRSLTRSLSNITNHLRRLSSSISRKEPQELDIRELVGQVKFKFYRDYADKKDLFEHNDVILTFERPEFKYVQRYLERQKMDVDKALEQIVETMKWRKSQELCHMTDSSFPDFCYKYGVIFLHEPDLEGNAVVHMRTKLHQKFHPHIADTLQKYLCHTVLKADQVGAASGAGWIVVADLTGISVRQFDIAYMTFILKLYLNYCPVGLRRIVVCNAHWLLKPIIKAAFAVLPGTLTVHMVSKDEIFKFVAKENLPKYLGGTCKINPRLPPGECPTLEEYVEKNYPPIKENLADAVRKYEKLIEDDVC